MATLSVLLTGAFFVLFFYAAKQLPASKGAPRAGGFAPDFSLPGSTGRSVALRSLLDSSFHSNDWPETSAAASGKTSALVLIFYRGYW